MDISITTQKPEAVNSTFSALPNNGLLYHQIIKYSTGKEIDALRQSDSNFYRWFRDKVQTPLRLPEYRTPGGLSPGRIYAVYRAITELETPQDAYRLQDSFIADRDTTTMAVWMKGMETLLEGGTIHRLEIMWTATEGGHLSVIQFLLKDGGDFLKSPHIIGILCEAAKKGHIHILEFFLHLNKFDITTTENTLLEILATSAYNGHTSVIEAFLKWGHQLSSKLRLELIGYAAMGGHPHMIEYLLKDGFEISPEDRIQIMKVAAGKGNLPIIEFFLKDNSEEERLNHFLSNIETTSTEEEDKPLLLRELLLLEATKSGRLSIIEFFLNDISQITPEQRIKIIKTIAKESSWKQQEKFLPIIEFLLQDGFQISPEDIRNILGIAARSGNAPMLEYLLNDGFQPSREERIALMKIAANGPKDKPKIFEFLLKDGFQISPEERLAIIELCAQHEKPKAIRVLLKDDFEIPREELLNILETAVAYKSVSVIWFFRERGFRASPEEFDRLLQAAREVIEEEELRFLLKFDRSDSDISSSSNDDA